MRQALLFLLPLLLILSMARGGRRWRVRVLGTTVGPGFVRREALSMLYLKWRLDWRTSRRTLSDGQQKPCPAVDPSLLCPCLIVAMRHRHWGQTHHICPPSKSNFCPSDMFYLLSVRHDVRQCKRHLWRSPFDCQFNCPTQSRSTAPRRTRSPWTTASRAAAGPSPTRRSRPPSWTSSTRCTSATSATGRRA